MKCPYCSKEMKKGVLNAKSAPIWSPREKLTLFKRKDEVRLGDIMQYTVPAAYHCETCGKIIVDLNNEINLASIDNGME